MHTRRTALKGLAAGALAVSAGRTFAQQEDKGQITVLVGAASSMDLASRLIAEQLRESTGRTAISLSRLGAGQRLALGDVRRAQPDGRTLVFATTGPFAIYPHIYTKLDYDPDTDFTPIIGISKFDVALAVAPQIGVTNMKELVDWAKAQPNEVAFGSAPGNGSFSHFVGIATALTTGARLSHVPYKDSGVGILDASAGRIPIMVTGLSPLIPMHKTGKIRILAVSGGERSPLVPEVPTLKEAGVNISRSTITGVFGPPKMPADLVNRLHEAIAPLIRNQAVVERLNQAAMLMHPLTGPQLAAAIREERDYFGVLAKQSGYQPEAA